MKLIKDCALIALIALGAAGPALAHHSFAMFDFTRQTVINGVVAEVQWRNPHVVIYVTAQPEPGRPGAVWWAELSSPRNLVGIGWSKQAFKVGDRVEVTLNPLRDGRHGGAFLRGKVLATGKVWSSDRPNKSGP